MDNPVSIVREIVMQELEPISADEWRSDPYQMSLVVAGTIAGRVQDIFGQTCGGKMHWFEKDVHTTVATVFSEHSGIPQADARLCSDAVLRFLNEPRFNTNDAAKEAEQERPL